MSDIPRRPLRVAYVVKMYPRFSETFIVNEILELERQGVDVRIFSLVKPADGRFHESIARVRAPVTYLPAPKHSDSWRFLQKKLKKKGGRWPGLHRAFAHAIACDESRSLKYLLLACSLAKELGDVDHLHAHFGSSTTQVAMYAAYLTGRTFSFTAHAKDIYHDEYEGSRLLADKIRAATQVVTVADDNLEYLIRTYGDWVSKRVVRIYNGLHLDLFRDADGEREENLVVGVGRLVEKKGFRYLVDAAAALRDEGRQLRVVIVGDGDHRESLEKQIADLDLGDTVELVGGLTQERVFDLLRRATLMALPCIIGADGNRDALPTVLLEALAAGLPSISTPITGIPEILDHGRAGVLVDPGSSTQLAEAIGKLLDDRDQRHAIAAAGRHRVDELFDVRTNVRLLHNLFRRSAGLPVSVPEPSDELDSQTVTAQPEESSLCRTERSA